MFDLFTIRDESNYLEKDKFIKMWWEKLPHWEQQMKIQYVTFRLKDSLPQEALQIIQQRKDNFLKLHPLPWDKNTAIEYHKSISKSEEDYLEKGYGECLLENKECREILEEALNYYNEKAYYLLAYVIMPNHVHLLIKMEDGYECDNVMTSAKRYAARNINKLLGRKGDMFTRNWDRLIRDYDHLRSVRHYIKQNPRFLRPEQYSLGGIMI